MKTILYNTYTGDFIHPVIVGKYLVDGVPGPLPDYIIELEIIELSPPVFDKNTQVAFLTTNLDLNNKLYIKSYSIRDLTPQEILDRQETRNARQCTPRQFRLALIQLGKDLNQIQIAIDNISDPALKQQTQVEWEYALEIKIDHPGVISIASTLNISEQELQDIFNLAVTL